ncbi:MAG: zinc transporter ZntB [Sphingomonadaceae bacterium]
MSVGAYIVDGATAHTATLDEATQAIGGAALVWVHFDGESEAVDQWLAARGIDHVVRSALLASETRPRMDGVDGGAILNLRGPAAGPGEHPDLLASIRLWVTQGWVVSVTLRTLPALDATAKALLAGHVRDPGDLVSVLAMQITAELDPDVAALGDTLDDCEEIFSAANALALRRRIGRTRAKAIAYRRFVAPQRIALERLAMVETGWLNDDDRLHLREAADRAARMAEELEAIRERAALIHEQLTDLRAELIETRTLVLSIAALVFLPLTFLTGLLGMNVEGIPFASEPWAFWGITVLCLVVAAGVAFYFIRARWFR